MSMFKTLQAFASKDATRVYLTGIYWDSEARCAVATDGHRLMTVSYDHLDMQGLWQTHDGKLLDFKTVTYNDAKYPYWKSLVPSEHDGKIIVDIPECFKGAKKGRNRVFLRVDGKHASPWAFYNTHVSDICIDAYLLNVFAGTSVTVKYNDPLKPIVVTDNTDLWTAVIMPMRK